MKTFKQFMEKLTPISEILPGVVNQIGKAGKIVGEEAVQMHGGMGCTEEMSIGHYLKRLVAISHLFGNPDYYLKKYSDS